MGTFEDLDGTRLRQMLDCEQVYLEQLRGSHILAHRFRGAMSWKTIAGRRYLYRKRYDRWVSLGPETSSTERAHDRFHTGRAALKRRITALDGQIRRMAPVTRAMGLGRVPGAAARILRRLDAMRVLGHGMVVTGTHALYAYERLAGVHFGSDVIATQDIDLLYDARGNLDLIGSGLAEHGLLGVLRTVDGSFDATGPGSFRAANDQGFMVDLIMPASQRHPSSQTARRRLGDDPNDLVAVEITGLAWLESAPRVTAVMYDERGFPLRMVVPDPRAFACHKAWLAQRPDRDPVKRRRDMAQARAVATMLATHLPELSFDDARLHGVPAQVMAIGPELVDRSTIGVEDWR